MANIMRSIKQVLVQCTVTQRLGIYVIFSVICSLFLSSTNPPVWFAITLTISWILVQYIHRLTYHISERCIFRFLDVIDEVEYVVKRYILNYTEVKKAKSISEVVSPSLTKGVENEEHLIHGESFNTPENEARICLQFIVRDFINSWYKEYISTENQPMEEAQEILEQLTIQTFDRLKTVEIIPLVKLVITRFQKHIADYNHAQEYWKQQPYFRSKRNRDKPEFKRMDSLVQAFQVCTISSNCALNQSRASSIPIFSYFLTKFLFFPIFGHFVFNFGIL